MGARVALLSGGKDSLYAAMHYWPPDYGLVLVYEFPEPSPHLVNLGKTVETLALTGVRVVVARLPKGREREETVRTLRMLGASEVIAGDVYIEDHLRYMESVAAEAGATLREPLWGRDPADLLHEILERGVRALVTGVRAPAPPELLGARLEGAGGAEWLAGLAAEGGWDPLGEGGEYHTLVLDSPVHAAPLEARPCGLLARGRVAVLRVC